MATRNFYWPAQGSSVVMSFDKDGTSTNVFQDTATPVNSDPLPVILYDTTGLADYSTETTLASVDTKLTSTNALLTTIDVDTGAISSNTGTTASNTGSIDTKLTTTNSVLGTIDADTGSIDTKLTSTNALLTTIDADTGAIATSVASVDLKLDTTNTTLSTIDGDTGNIATSVSSVDGKLTSTNALLTTIDADTGSIATSSTSIDGKLPATLGQKAMSASLSVTLASDQTTLVTKETRSVVTTYRNDYTSVNVTTSAYVQMVASTGDTINAIEIFDSSGKTLELAIGAAASETRLIYVFQGGNGLIPVTIASGTRVSLKAISANATTGEIVINFYK